MSVAYFEESLGAAHSILVDICFFNIFCVKKAEKQEKARNLMQNLQISFLSLHQNAGLGFNPRKNAFSQAKTRHFFGPFVLIFGTRLILTSTREKRAINH